MRISTAFLLTISILVLISSCKQKVKKETNILKDDLYIDSLNKYFVPFERRLIQQYRINHENLKNDEDFYLFYRNASTLRKMISKTLKIHALEDRKKGVEILPSMKWFQEVAKGLEVSIVYHETTYEVFFDYIDFHEHAAQTIGNRDNDFVKLLEICYNAHSYFTKWEKPKTEFLGCNVVGNGLYTKIFNSMDSVLMESALFEKEIMDLQKHLIGDLYHKPYYCYSKGAVLKELSDIVRNNTSLQGRIKAKLTDYIKKLKANQGKAQFNCNTKDCSYPH